MAETLSSVYNTRYNNSKIIDYDIGVTNSEGTTDIITTTCLETFKFPEYEITDSDLDFIVTPEYENRLDKISYKYYNTPMYWWIIAMYNNIYNPLYVRAGTRLVIPVMDNVIDILGETHVR